MYTALIWSRSKEVISVTALWAKRFGVRTPTGTADLFLHQKVQADCGAYPSYYPVRTAVFPGGVTAWA